MEFSRTIVHSWQPWWFDWAPVFLLMVATLAIAAIVRRVGLRARVPNAHERAAWLVAVSFGGLVAGAAGAAMVGRIAVLAREAGADGDAPAVALLEGAQRTASFYAATSLVLVIAAAVVWAKAVTAVRSVA
jgi:hypothetical protein